MIKVKIRKIVLTVEWKGNKNGFLRHLWRGPFFIYQTVSRPDVDTNILQLFLQ